MISAIFDVIAIILGLILDIITLPFRIALLGGDEVRVPAFQPHPSPDGLTGDHVGCLTAP